MHWQLALIVYLSLGVVAAIIASLLTLNDLWGQGFLLSRLVALMVVMLILIIGWPIFVPALQEELRGWRKARYNARQNRRALRAAQK